MADTEVLSVLEITRGDKIDVIVESILPDIIVVSFAHGVKVFQGALLHVNERGLPCGINPPESTTDPDGDKFASLAARFTYFQEKKPVPVKNKIDLRRNINPPARYRNVGPTVRLRPRQVLCNKCRSICNEKSENVDVGRKRKYPENQTQQENANDAIPVARRSERRCVQQQQQREVKSRVNGAIDRAPSLIPKISRLESSKINENSDDKLGENIRMCWLRRTSNDTAWNTTRNFVINNCSTAVVPSESSESEENINTICRATPRRLSSSSVESANMPDDIEKLNLPSAYSTSKTKTNQVSRVSRKKRSVGSMEDLWDETVFEDMTKSSSRATPIIKISFGTQGEGTILKIPSKIKNAVSDELDETDPLEFDQFEQVHLDDNTKLNKINGDIEVQQQIDLLKLNGIVKDLACEKAAKRALKKAKKEARRKILGAVSSPVRSPLNTSPRYNPTYEPMMYYRRKHKVKHKKKHKEARKQHKNQQLEDKSQTKELTSSLNEDKIHKSDCNNILPGGESYTAIKEQCLKQKLSISLKRLNTNAYARCDYPVSNASSGCKSPGASSEELSEIEREQSMEHDVDSNDTISHFSPPALRFAATPVEHCLTTAGKRMDVGDIVWGKIHGFPWWPGKILSISISCKEDGTSSGAQAHVAWYGSSTCSLMSCDQLSPFLETFKARYNKKKRGPYKEAIRQAQSEAQSQMSNSRNNDVLNVCESPREVNVLS